MRRGRGRRLRPPTACVYGVGAGGGADAAVVCWTGVEARRVLRLSINLWAGGRPYPGCDMLLPSGGTRCPRLRLPGGSAHTLLSAHLWTQSLPGNRSICADAACPRARSTPPFAQPFILLHYAQLHLIKSRPPAGRQPSIYDPANSILARFVHAYVLCISTLNHPWDPRGTPLLETDAAACVL